MQFQTVGLIIKESTVGESDRTVTVLTRDQGLLRAFVHKAKEMKNRGSSATQLLCYSRLTVYKGREKYIIGDARPIRVFFELRNDITALSLAQYFCELAGKFSPEGVPSEEYLRLLLNALEFLCKNTKPQLLLKAAVEMRLLSLAGFMPSLVGCSKCGEYITDKMYFYPERGEIVCENCYQNGQGVCFLLPGSVISALRHVVYSDFEKLFSFTLSENGIKAMAAVSEAYTLSHIGYELKTLDFYKKIST